MGFSLAKATELWLSLAGSSWREYPLSKLPERSAARCLEGKLSNCGVQNWEGSLKRTENDRAKYKNRK